MLTVSQHDYIIRLKVCVDLGGQTAEFYAFKAISTTILTYFNILGINTRSLIYAINTRFQPDAPRWQMGKISLRGPFSWVKQVVHKAVCELILPAAHAGLALLADTEVGEALQ